MTEVFLREDIAAHCDSGSAIPWARQVAAEAAADDVYRDKEGRKTLRFVLGGRPYFLKLHLGIGWGEIFKNLFQLRLPVTSARNEYEAVKRLEGIDIPTLSVAAYACEGSNPAHRRSMLVTDELTGTVSLEDFCATWPERPPTFAVRSKLIRVLAETARAMHAAGINHRDFYLCHFHLAEDTLSDARPRCHLIDLHRAQLRGATPRRWRIKDLAGLYFSAMDCGISQRDLLRFLRHSDPRGLRAALGPKLRFWQQVERRARALYQREHGKPPPALAATERR